MGYCPGRKQGCMEAAPSFLRCSESLLPWGILADSQAAADTALFVQVLAARTRAEQWQAKQPPHSRVSHKNKKTTPTPKNNKPFHQTKNTLQKKPLYNFYRYPSFSLKVYMLCLSLYMSIFPLPSTPSEESLSKMQQTKSVTILHCFHLELSYISVKQEQAEGTSPTISNYGRKSKDISPSAIHQLQNWYISGGFHSSGYALALCWWVRMDKHEPNYS